MRAACLALALLGCAPTDRTDAEVQSVMVEDGAQHLSIRQHFNAKGELTQTVVQHGDARLFLDGELLDGDGATDSGQRLRAFFLRLPSPLLARLWRRQPRFDIAVLAVDALLALDPSAQRAAARALGHPEPGPLCSLLSACEESVPQT